MSIGKLRKFAELATFPNVFQSPRGKHLALRDHLGVPVSMKGKWAEHFRNPNPIVVELACGRGEYTVALARSIPHKNFIGIDIKGARLWKGAREALDGALQNVAFVRAQVDHLPELFAPDEVSEIWITFPDPYLNQSKSQKRLTSSRFLDTYKRVLQDGGLIHLKTDSEPLFHFTIETITDGNHILLERVDDVWGMSPVPDYLRIKTYYEQMHLHVGRTIKYLKFKLQ
jgi:tRNA (guanine-N7-)-methyltransferase